MRLLANNTLKYRERTKRKFCFRFVNESYTEITKGVEEPTILFVSKKINDEFVEISRWFDNKSHLGGDIWRIFRNASVVMSGELEDNQMLFINLNRIDDEFFNALITFEEI